MSCNEPRRLTLPLDRTDLEGLQAGDACLFTGPLFTLRDAGHIRLLEELDAANCDDLPYGLDGQAIFYAGPTPAAAGRPFGAIGPTTASRIDSGPAPAATGSPSRARPGETRSAS